MRARPPAPLRAAYAHTGMRHPRPRRAGVRSLGWALRSGTLHAHGKLVETHHVSYSIGLCGVYLLHVRLRHSAVALPGSPFRLEVFPNVAHAGATRLPRGLIYGHVGDGAEAGCGMSVTTHDLMGNLCIAGGAEVTGELVVKAGSKGQAAAAAKVAVSVNDNQDGTYYLHWRSEVSGTYTAAIKIGGVPVLGSPATIQLVSVTPQLSKTELTGDGLTSCVAGDASKFKLRFFDMYDNPAQPQVPPPPQPKALPRLASPRSLFRPL